MSEFLLWLGLFFIVAFPALLSAIGLSASNVWAIIGAVVMFIGLVWSGINFKKTV